MALFTRNVGLLVLLVFVWSLTMCDAGILPNVGGALPNVTHVNITNDLGGDLTLTIHCKSGDDDLGAHVLPPLISYEFVFRPNMWWTTQYFCSVEWPGASHYIDIYIQKRDQDRCDICMWVIVPYGGCLFNYKTRLYDICYPWNPPRY